MGRVERGDGGFNAPHRWHLAPDSVRFADVTIEACQGCAHAIDENLDYWAGTIGTYCAVGIDVIGRE